MKLFGNRGKSKWLTVIIINVLNNLRHGIKPFLFAGNRSNSNAVFGRYEMKKHIGIRETLKRRESIIFIGEKSYIIKKTFIFLFVVQ